MNWASAPACSETRVAGLQRSPEPLLGSDAAVDAAGPCQGLLDTTIGACQLDHRFAWSTTCNLIAAVERSYTSAFSDQGPEASVVSSHYQAPSPSSRPSSQTAPVQQAVEAADPENSALLGKVMCTGITPSVLLNGPTTWMEHMTGVSCDARPSTWRLQGQTSSTELQETGSQDTAPRTSGYKSEVCQTKVCKKRGMCSTCSMVGDIALFIPRRTASSNSSSSLQAA